MTCFGVAWRLLPATHRVKMQMIARRIHVGNLETVSQKLRKAQREAAKTTAADEETADSAARTNEQQSEADRKHLKSIPAPAREFWVGFDDALAAAQAQLQAAQAAKRAAHPIKQQFENAQAY